MLHQKPLGEIHFEKWNSLSWFVWLVSWTIDVNFFFQPKASLSMPRQNLMVANQVQAVKIA